MNLRSLEYFLVVAEEMSFSRAAERLFLTQQALSSHIKRLEEEYDAELFHRKPVLSLTQKGMEMRYWAMQILSAEKNLRSSLYDIGTNCRGRVRIGMSRLRANRMMPEILARYREFYPNVSFELTDGSTDRLQNALEEHKVDMYMGYNVETGMNEVEDRLVAEAIWCCGDLSLIRKYLGENRTDEEAFLSEEPDIRTMQGLPLLVTSHTNRIRRQLDKYFYDAGIRPNIYIETNSQPLLIDMARQKIGLAVVSPIVLYNFWREINDPANSLCAFPLSRELPENVLSLVYRRDDPMPQYARDFIQVVKEIFGRYGRLLDMEEQTLG